MAVGNSGVSSRARSTIAGVTVGAIAILAFAVMAGTRTAANSSASASQAQQNPEQLRKDALNKIAGLPLYFEANRGQADASVRYLARSGRYSLFLTDDAAVFSLIGGKFEKAPVPKGFPYMAEGDTHLTESAVRVRLLGANSHPRVEGMQPLPGHVNYLIGEQKNWHRDVPTFGKVRFHDVYPGVDVVYYGSPDRLEYDFIAAPGADVSKIDFAIEGPATTTQDAAGDIVIQTASGTIKLARPRNYQLDADGGRTPIDGSFRLAKNGAVVAGVPTREVGFQIADYDRARALYIDPVVIPYSTYFGGDASSTGPVNLEQFGTVLQGTPIPGVAETGLDVALDGASPPHAYIVGSAYSNDLPTAGFFQPALAGADAPPTQNPNVFIAEFNTNKSNAQSLVYATYLGAQGDTRAGAAGKGDGDLGFGIAADADGDVFVVGQTYSGNSHSTGPDFPGVASCGTWGTTGKNNGTNASTNVGFVSELAAGGDSLDYSCYIPGSHNATAARVAVVPGCASNCQAYVVGSTQSTAASDGFIVTANAAQSELATGEGGLSNAFMMVIGAGGSAAAPVYSTFYGGTGNGGNADSGIGISVASATNVAITGGTFSGGTGMTGRIPLSADPAQSTYLGGTNSTSMAFVATFNPTAGAGSTLTYGSYLGGSGNFNGLASVGIGDVGTAIVIDGSNLWVAGLTGSTNFPVDGVTGVGTAKPPFEDSNEAETDTEAPATTGFITELTPSGTAGLGQVTYSTYFGGTGFSIDGLFGVGDAIGAMAEHSGVVYVTGLTASATGGASGFPHTANACRTTNDTTGITIDSVNVPVTAFVSALNTTNSVAADQLIFSTLLGGTGIADVGLGLAFDPVAGQAFVTGVTYSTDFPVTPNAYQFVNNASGSDATNAFLTVLNPTSAASGCPTPFVTPTPTATSTGGTPTATATATASKTATATLTATPTATPTGTSGTPTTTATATATRTATATATATSTGSATPTATATATRTATPTATATATPTATATATATSTGSSTPTATRTATATATATTTATATATATMTATGTPSMTATPTATATPEGVVKITPTNGLKFKADVDTTTKPRKVKIKNASSKKSNISVTVTGETTAAPFAVSSQCTTTLAPGKSCDVEVTFSPTTDTTPQMGTLTITDNAMGEPQSVNLIGTVKVPKK